MIKKVEYKWIPKKGISTDAVRRMRRHFKRPTSPMGEAWFIGTERRLYTELLEKPVEEIDAIDLSTNILFEISSGTKCFGQFKEWDEWFKYLLPRLILRSNEILFCNTLLAQSVVTAFMIIYWDGISEEYDGFRNDVISSLSLCLMNEELWFDYTDEITNGNHPRAHFLNTFRDGAGNLRLDWDSRESNESLSALMFFCLKYLTPKEIDSWVDSLFSIEDIYWKGALAVWLSGALDILKKPTVYPSMIERASPKLAWENSHILDSNKGSTDAENLSDKDFNNNKDFLPTENVACFLSKVSEHLTDNLILEWAELFAQDKLVAGSTSSIPEQLLDKISKSR